MTASTSCVFVLVCLSLIPVCLCKVLVVHDIVWSWVLTEEDHHYLGLCADSESVNTD